MVLQSTVEKAEKVVYFVRHGQSEDNISPVFQSTETNLSERGKEQADYIAKRISKLSFDKLVSSPLNRARQTAEKISKLTGKEIEFSDIFVERIKPTSINGKPHTDQESVKKWRLWEESITNRGQKVEDGENYSELLDRAKNALDYLHGLQEREIVAVTHGYFLRTIVALVLMGESISPETFSQFQKVAHTENTGLTALTYEGGFEQEPCWRLWVYNDHAHLAE